MPETDSEVLIQAPIARTINKAALQKRSQDFTYQHNEAYREYIKWRKKPSFH